MTELKSKLTNLKSDLDAKRGQLSLLSNQMNDSIIKMNDTKSSQTKHKKCIEALNSLQLTTKQQLKDEIEGLVTMGLISILGEGYGFKVVFDRRGNAAETNFQIITPKSTTENVEDESGFVLDVVSMCLQFVLCNLFPVGDVIILDEPFKNASEATSYDKLMNVIEFLKEISSKFNKQVILITHHKLFAENSNNKIVIGG